MHRVLIEKTCIFICTRCWIAPTPPDAIPINQHDFRKGFKTPIMGSTTCSNDAVQRWGREFKKSSSRFWVSGHQ